MRTLRSLGLAGGSLLVFMAALSLPACEPPPRLVVASKNFTEQVILGEILAQHLEHRLGAAVERRLNLGGTLLAHQALVSGDVTLYPEYTGTALTTVLDLPLASDPDQVFQTVRHAYRARWDVEWLEPLGFTNTFAMVVRGEEARALGLRTLSDAARADRGWTLGVGYEFQQRPDGLAGLLGTYQLTLDGPVKTMDLGLLYQALRQGDVTMVAANSTDGLLSVLDVRVLEDDRRYFPPYEAAIAVRGDALRQHRGLREALEELSGLFTNAAMRRLNYEVDGRHRAPRDVAADFLRARGLAPTSLSSSGWSSPGRS